MEEIPEAIKILVQASERLEQLGIPLWKPEQFRPETLEPLAHSGELHLAFFNHKAVGTMYLQLEDELFWSDEPPGESLFIHKLAVASQARGTGVARAMMAFSKLEVRRLKRKFLRLDCADRSALRRLYEGEGLVFRDFVQVGSFYACRYELEIRA
jgi:GNAT superfamily N-acetyltransferase